MKLCDYKGIVIVIIYLLIIIYIKKTKVVTWVQTINKIYFIIYYLFLIRIRQKLFIGILILSILLIGMLTYFLAFEKKGILYSI